MGHNDNNVRILNLAYRVRDAIPGTQIVMAPTDPDLRNYNVRFDKLAGLLDGRTFSSGRARDFRKCSMRFAPAASTRTIAVGTRCSSTGFLLDVERTYREMAMDGRVLS